MLTAVNFISVGNDCLQDTQNLFLFERLLQKARGTGLGTFPGASLFTVT